MLSQRGVHLLHEKLALPDIDVTLEALAGIGQCLDEFRAGHLNPRPIPERLDPSVQQVLCDLQGPSMRSGPSQVLPCRFHQSPRCTDATDLPKVPARIRGRAQP